VYVKDEVVGSVIGVRDLEQGRATLRRELLRRREAGKLKLEARTSLE